MVNSWKERAVVITTEVLRPENLIVGSGVVTGKYEFLKEPVRVAFINGRKGPAARISFEGWQIRVDHDGNQTMRGPVAAFHLAPRLNPLVACVARALEQHSKAKV